MRSIVLAAAFTLAACGGDSNSVSSSPPSPAPTSPPTTPTPATNYPGYDLDTIINAIRKPGNLPPFPLGTPTYDRPPFNADGIILDARTGTVNPTIAARYALNRYHLWVTQNPFTADQALIDEALKQTDWLAANIDCSSKTGIWKHDFPASFDAQPGWGGGFTNGHGIVALITMSRFINDPKRYLEPAFCAINAFDADVANGGLRTAAGNGYFFEEYATPTRSGVLNGHVFGLASLHYACQYGSILKACRLFDQGYAGLLSKLPQYDAGIISRYSLVEGNYAGAGYNDLNAFVLRWLNTVRPDPELQKYVTRFEDYRPETFEVIASTSSGPDNTAYNLTDGVLWYNYWSSFDLPATLDFDTGSEQPIRALAMSFVGDYAAPFQYSIDGGTWYNSPVPETPARHTIEVHKSAVGIYNIAMTGRRVSIRFNQPSIGDVVALREINVLH